MKNVLLVDDDSTFQFLGKSLLSRMGVSQERVQIASNGQQAIDLFDAYLAGTKDLPDVILLDLNMPVMDGFEFLKAFARLDHPGKEKIKVVIVSSSNNSEDVRRAKELGASAYITKPLQVDSLKAYFE